jgi:polysaccharide chain length determinant protein (PEP-CTERM system associated)
VIPGKQYRPEDYLEMAWRRRWILLVPLVLFAVVTFFYSQTLPNRYRSEATILVIPPQVPANVVRPTIEGTLAQRLEQIRQQLLSQNRLERIIQEFDLYPAERQTRLMESVIERMRRDIKVATPKAGRKQDPGHFTVSYESESPQAAVAVAERLASLFVRENLERRNIRADATAQFVQSQVDEALRRLQDQEGRLEAFRRQNIGKLPSEVQSNLAMIQTTRQELQALTDANNRDRERQITIERTIADEVAFGGIAAAGAPRPGEAPQTAAQELAAVRAGLERMQLRLKDDHPDVRTAKRRIGELEQRAAEEALAQPLSADGAAAAISPTDVARQKRISGLRTEFELLERNITARNAQAARLQAMASDYRQRVELAPALESQLSQLLRGYETLKSTHESLLRKSQEAEVAANLEERQVSEQFRIIDPPRRPERPQSPDRVRMNLIGALLGLGLGVAIAGLLEYRDTALRSEDDVLIALSLPVVATVPTMWTAEERQAARRRRMLLIGSSAVVTLVISAAALVWKLRLLDSWIR